MHMSRAYHRRNTGTKPISINEVHRERLFSGVNFLSRPANRLLSFQLSKCPRLSPSALSHTRSRPREPEACTTCRQAPPPPAAAITAAVTPITRLPIYNTACLPRAAFSRSRHYKTWPASGVALLNRPDLPPADVWLGGRARDVSDFGAVATKPTHADDGACGRRFRTVSNIAPVQRPRGLSVGFRPCPQV